MQCLTDVEYCVLPGGTLGYPSLGNFWNGEGSYTQIHLVDKKTPCHLLPKYKVKVANVFPRFLSFFFATHSDLDQGFSNFSRLWTLFEEKQKFLALPDSRDKTLVVENELCPSEPGGIFFDLSFSWNPLEFCWKCWILWNSL